jgi:hypothetical protein
MVGLIYLGCVLVLTVLISLADRQHRTAAEDLQVFRFPSFLVNTLKVGIAVPGFLGISAYESFPSPGILEASVLAGIFGSMTAIVAVSFWRTRRFRAEVGFTYITVIERRLPITIRFSDIKTAIVVWPWRGSGRLDLLNGRGTLLCRIDGGVQDFDELVDIVVSRCNAGTIVKEKDTSGRWSDRTN